MVCVGLTRIGKCFKLTRRCPLQLRFSVVHRAPRPTLPPLNRDQSRCIRGSGIQPAEVREDRAVLLDVCGEFAIEPGTVVGCDVFFECVVIAVDLEDKI